MSATRPVAEARHAPQTSGLSGADAAGTAQPGWWRGCFGCLPPAQAPAATATKKISTLATEGERAMASAAIPPQRIGGESAGVAQREGVSASSTADGPEQAGAHVPGQSQPSGVVGHFKAAGGLALGVVNTGAELVIADDPSWGSVVGHVEQRLGDLQQDAGAEVSKEDYWEAVGSGAMALVDKFANRVLNKVEDWQRGGPIGPVDIQTFKFTVNEVETTFLKYKAVGHVIVGVLSTLAHGAPFGGSVLSMAIVAVYARAEQTATTSANCNGVLQVVKLADRMVTAVEPRVKVKDGKPPSNFQEHLLSLQSLVTEAAQLLSRYCGRGFLKRFLTASSDAEEFNRLHLGVHRSLSMLTSEIVLLKVVLEKEFPNASYKDEGSELRKAICEAGRSKDPNEAVATLVKTKKGQQQLHKLLRDKGSFSDEVITGELEELFARVTLLEEKVVMHDKTLEEIKQKQDELSKPHLEGFLYTWWNEHVGRIGRTHTVASKELAAKMLNWFLMNKHVKALNDWEDDLVKHGVLPAGAPRPPFLFLEYVVLRVLDQDRNGTIDQSELLVGQLQAEAYASAAKAVAPRDMVSFVDIIATGFDYSVLPKVDDGDAAGEAAAALDALLDELDGKLGVRSIIRSYNLGSLLAEYVPNTRQWLYEDVNDWLLQVAPGGYKKASSDSRAYLLLAGPGMGKSMFSAVMHTKLSTTTKDNVGVHLVRHFFKAGQLRSEGRAMLLSLAYQMAQQLGSFMAAALVPVAAEHGTCADLDLDTIFYSFLLQPLQAFEKCERAAGRPLPVLLVLLDALDEATHNGKPGSWAPVAKLVARRFVDLPSWVKVIQTSRPDTLQSFSGTRWSAKWIEPSNKNNQDDVRVLLQAKVAASQNVAKEDVQAVADILHRKSKGELVYVKFALDYLAFKTDLWTVAEVEALPEAAESMPTVYGAYCLLLNMVASALQREKPELLALLTDKLLPFLVASLTPLSLDQLALACEEEGSAANSTIRAQLQTLLELLGNLFLLRASGDGSERVYPYHKTVLDWLKDEAAAGHFFVNEEAAHRMLGCRLAAEVLRQAAGAEPGTLLTRLPVEEGGTRGSRRLQLDPYVLDFTVEHLVGPSGHASPSKMLDVVLANWDFLHDVMVERKGCQLLAALSRLHLAQRSAYTEDTRRWLGRFVHGMQEQPTLMERLTVISCPVKSRKYCEAVTRLQLHWHVIRTLGGDGGSWPADVWTLQGHTDRVLSVAFSPDGKQLATGSCDMTAKVWDVGTGECTATLQGHAHYVRSVAFSPDSKQLATGSDDKSAKVWDVGTGECTATLQGHSDHVVSVAFSPDGMKLATGSLDRSANVWEVCSERCTLMLQGHTDYVYDVAFSFDGKQLATAGDRTAKIWDAESGACTVTLQHQYKVTCVTFSPDGKLATAGESTGAKVWDVGSRKCTTTLQGHPERLFCIAFSPDGTQLATGCEDMIARVWDVGNGLCTATLQGHTSIVFGVAFSPDGSQLATGSGDKTTKVWDVDVVRHTPKPQGHSSIVWSVAFSPDGKQLATGSADNSAMVWDVGNGQCIATLQGHTQSVTSIAFSPDGKQLATGSEDCAAKIWHIGSGQCTATLQEHIAYVTSIAFSPAGRRLATGSIDKTIKIWDVSSGRCHATLQGWPQGHESAVYSVAFSPDGKQLASGSYDKTAKVWDLGRQQCTATLQGHTHYVYSVAFSPDGKQLATGSADKTVKIWNVGSGHCTVTLQGHSASVFSVTFSPDGKQLTTGSFDKTVKAWDVGNWQCSAILQGHTDLVNSIAFSPDGKQLATGSRDKTAKVWEMCTRQSPAVP